MGIPKDIAPLLFHDARQSMSLGCVNCPEQGLCGGLHTSGSNFDCMAFCECNDPAECQYVCPKNIEHYIARVHEILGFDFENVPRAPALSYPSLPLSVPLLYHSSVRSGRLAIDTVAVPLSHLLDRRTGVLRFGSREAVAEAFGFDEAARLIITGVDQDQPIEDYWSFRRATRIPEQLAALRPDLITVPNYSVFLDSPRWDNLHNMKRIALCWSELVSTGIPTSLHLNARTDRDWERWTEFICEREEVKSVAFEFATGPARLERGTWHAEKLAALASAVPRDLQLVLRGGYVHLKELYRAFSEVVFIDTTSFMKTVNRQKLVRRLAGKLECEPAGIPKMHPLDALLSHNVWVFAEMIFVAADESARYLPDR